VVRGHRLTPNTASKPCVLRLASRLPFSPRMQVVYVLWCAPAR
jgi:hypothetical protein